MSVIYNKYSNSIDYIWYDSSNILYSECYDIDSENKNLKVIFKGGRTYLYKDVNIKDYLMVKMSESNGKMFNECIVKKYKGIRLSDTDLKQLEELKNRFTEEDKIINEEKIKNNLNYKLIFENDEKTFSLLLNDNIIFTGKDKEFSITQLLKCMNINYELEIKK